VFSICDAVGNMPVNANSFRSVQHLRRDQAASYTEHLEYFSVLIFEVVLAVTMT